MNSRNHMKMQKHVICKETFEEKYIKDKKYKVRDSCH